MASSINLKLRKLSLQDKEDLAVFNLLQILPQKENGFVNRAFGLSFAQYQDWIISQEKSSRGVGLEDGYVPQTTYWLLNNDQIIGIGRVRHRLNDKLKNLGGNIGYAIHPNFRGQGFGKRLLGLLIKEAQKLNLTEVLITCSAANIPSQKVIISNGGQLVSQTEKTNRYMIIPSMHFMINSH